MRGTGSGEPVDPDDARSDEPDDAGDGLDDTMPLSPIDGFDDDLDDDFDDLVDTGPLLPADDRLWRHPSELRYLEAAARSPEPEPTRGASTRLVVGVAMGASLVGALLGIVALRLAEPGDGTTVVERHIDSDGFAQEASLTTGVTVADIASAVSPAVARLTVEHDGERGTGSGIVFRSDGLVLTNAHVVDGATDVRVVLADGREFGADVLGTDPHTDVAVVDIEAQGLDVATLGTDDDLVTGQDAVAIGSPLGLDGGPTVTVGVISALGRALETSTGTRLYGLIQTDAPIAPGSSGGALVDARGAVIGMTTAIVVTGQGAEGLGFAIPIDVAYDAAAEIVEDGTADHAWIGITGQSVEPDQDGSAPNGIEVVTVAEDGPAATAGIEQGDIVTALDGLPVTSMADLIAELREHEPGEPIVLSTADGMHLQVQLGRR